MKYPDVEVAFKCLTGFPLIGELDETGVFPTRNLEELNVGAGPICLARMAKQARKALVDRFNCDETDTLTEEIYELTREEVDKGWAKGPSPRRN